MEFERFKTSLSGRRILIKSCRTEIMSDINSAPLVWGQGSGTVYPRPTCSVGQTGNRGKKLDSVPQCSWRIIAGKGRNVYNWSLIPATRGTKKLILWRSVLQISPDVGFWSSLNPAQGKKASVLVRQIPTDHGSCRLILAMKFFAWSLKETSGCWSIVPHAPLLTRSMIAALQNRQTFLLSYIGQPICKSL